MQHTLQSIDEMKARIREMKVNKGRRNIDAAVRRARSKMNHKQLQPEPDPVDHKTEAEIQSDRELKRSMLNKAFYKEASDWLLVERQLRRQRGENPPKPVTPVEPILMFPQLLNPVDNPEIIEESIISWTPPTLKEICLRVCALHHVSLTELCSVRRNNRIAFARQHAFYLSRKYTMHSLPTIGRQIGKRDHTTILHGVRKITEVLKERRKEPNRQKRILERRKLRELEEKRLGERKKG